MVEQRMNYAEDTDTGKIQEQHIVRYRVDVYGETDRKACGGVV